MHMYGVKMFSIHVYLEVMQNTQNTKVDFVCVEITWALQNLVGKN